MSSPVAGKIQIGLLLFALAWAATLNLQGQELDEVQICTDSLFHSPQRITIFRLNKEELDKYRIELAYHASKLQKTSQFATDNKALAAINGSFFDMNEGGSVTYMEKGDSVISYTRPDTLKWAVPDSLANGAIFLTKENRLQISRAFSDQYFEGSEKEKFVLVSGPLLIHRSLAQKLPDMGFSRKRHPRSCLGITEESLIFITVDGRADQAAGMNLFELQSYLLELGCTEAINLDGGGSTTLWTSSRGVVNLPSDSSGERSVANALLIVREKMPAWK
jgi:exopolysaccharide biosynthesis protein